MLNAGQSHVRPQPAPRHKMGTSKDLLVPPKTPKAWGWCPTSMSKPLQVPWGSVSRVSCRSKDCSIVCRAMQLGGLQTGCRV